MDNYFALTNAGFESFYSTFVLGCAQWKDGTTLESINKAVKRLQAQGALK